MLLVLLCAVEVRMMIENSQTDEVNIDRCVCIVIIVVVV